MSKQKSPTVVVFCGLPASGKSELAKRVSAALDIPYYDIDDHARTPYFGLPPKNDGSDPKIDQRDKDEMAGAYKILFGLVDGHLRAGRSLIVTATFSSKKWGQDVLKAICDQNHGAKLKVVWCKWQLTNEQLRQRIKDRERTGYTGATASVDRIRELEKRYEPILLPHLEIDTSPPNTPVQCAQEALEYILS